MSPRLKIVRVEGPLQGALQGRIAALEQLASYPLGLDTFQIDHGPDYFAFFTRMGHPAYYAAMLGEEVVAVGAGVLRRVPFRAGAKPRRTWYLCDLKVHPSQRGEKIPLRMLRHAFLLKYLSCPRGFGVTMNPGDGSPNRVIKLVSHWRWSPIRLSTTLSIWSCDAERMRDLAPLVTELRGPISYLSLAGVKDIVLQSTGRPLPLLHVQFDPQAGALRAPQEGHTHMFCAPEGDPLERALAARGVRPDATASVVSHGMRGCDWRFIQTSEI